MFVGIYFLRFEGGCENRQINSSQTLMNLQYMICVRAQILSESKQALCRITYTTVYM